MARASSCESAELSGNRSIQENGRHASMIAFECDVTPCCFSPGAMRGSRAELQALRTMSICSEGSQRVVIARESDRPGRFPATGSDLQGRCQLLRQWVTHLLVNVEKEMIEAFDAYQAEPRKFHVRDYVEGDRQSARENHHMHPAACFCRGHSEASKQRTTQPKAEEHDVDDIGGMFFGCAKTRSRDLESVRK